MEWVLLWMRGSVIATYTYIISCHFYFIIRPSLLRTTMLWSYIFFANSPDKKEAHLTLLICFYRLTSILLSFEIWHCVLESCQLMHLPPRQSTAEADLMIPFQLAALKTIGDEDKYFSRVSLRYRRVFQYLIRLKRTQMELEKSWALAMHQGHTDFAKDRKDHIMSQQCHRRSPFWRVQEHMTFLIRNLQFYIQVDVIESQWNVLQCHVQESRDFTELVDFHQEYLSALISQSFLDIGSVSRILDSIMELCLQFCWIIERQESNSNSSELDHITEEFNKKSNSLYTILCCSRLAGSQWTSILSLSQQQEGYSISSGHVQWYPFSSNDVVYIPGVLCKVLLKKLVSINDYCQGQSVN